VEHKTSPIKNYSGTQNITDNVAELKVEAAARLQEKGVQKKELNSKKSVLLIQ